jgi:hypothetical protein
MRAIEIEDGVTIRFPLRSEEFADGFEAGLVAAALTGLPHRHDATIAAGTIPAITKLARCYGYRLVQGPEENGMVRLSLIRADLRPKLYVVPTPAVQSAD